MTVDLFRTRDHVADFDDRVRDYALHSAEARGALRSRLGLRYGDEPGQTLDLFFPEATDRSLPAHIFIHGGYWRMFAREDFSYVARTVTDAGAIAVVIDYALMPAVRLGDVVRQVREAKAWVTRSIAGFGGDPDRITVSGHSAGAHLASLLFTDDQPDPPGAALLLGGIYDIAPLQTSFLHPLIGLTDDEVRDWSPLTHRFHAGITVDVLHGALETQPFHMQAERFAAHLRDQGYRVTQQPLDGADHMSSVLDLGIPGTQAASRLAALIRTTNA